MQSSSPPEPLARATAIGKKITPAAIAETMISSPVLAPTEGSAATPAASAIRSGPADSGSRRKWPWVVAAIGVCLGAFGGYVAWDRWRGVAKSEPSANAPSSATVTEVAHSASPPGLDEAKTLLKIGRSTTALEILRKLRARYPGNAEVPYVMGRVYFDKLWWSDGFEAYQAAVARNPAYRQDPTLISDVLKSLVSEKESANGARFIEREVGAAAIPYVEELTASKNQNIRARAKVLLARLKSPG